MGSCDIIARVVRRSRDGRRISEDSGADGLHVHGRAPYTDVGGAEPVVRAAPGVRVRGEPGERPGVPEKDLLQVGERIGPPRGRAAGPITSHAVGSTWTASRPSS